LRDCDVLTGHIIRALEKAEPQPGNKQLAGRPGETSQPAVVAPDPELVGQAARYIENGAGGSDYIAYILSKEIIRIAEIMARNAT